MGAATGSAAGSLGPVSGKGLGRFIAGGLALLFGLATLVEGGQVLFGSAEPRAEAGKVVPFVLAFNFAAGFFYLATGALTILKNPVAVWLARILAVATVLVFVALGVHIMGGGEFENRTVVAMSIRSLFWSVQALALPFILGRGRAQS